MQHQDDGSLSGRVGSLPVRDPVESQDVAVLSHCPVLLSWVAIAPDQGRLGTGQVRSGQVRSDHYIFTVGSSFLG